MRRIAVAGVTVLMVLASTAVRANGVMVLRKKVARPVSPRPGPTVRPTMAWVKKAHLDVSIEGQNAKVTVDEEFYNPNNWQAEGVFVFPLPADAAIHDMYFWMNGKKHKAEMLDATQARNWYLQTVRRMYDPALLEYAGGKMFRLRVFPIPPKKTAKVKFTYSVMMKREGDVAVFRYPTGTNKYSAGDIDDFVINVKINSQEPLKNIYCPTYAVDTKRISDKEALVAFEGRKVRPEKDFLLYLNYSEKAVGFSMFTFNDGTEDGYFMMLITPKYELSKEEILPKDIVFVVDTSGSMRWNNQMEQAQAALVKCVESLGERDRFGIVSFATDVRTFNSELMAATAENRKKAVEWVKRLEPLGGTDINEALLKALEMAPKTTEGSQSKRRPFMVVFLTDGEPTVGVDDPLKILKNVKDANTVRARLFVFGVGEEVNVKLLDRLADENHGLSDYISKDERIDEKVGAFYTKIASPVLSDLKMQVKGMEMHDVFPKELPDLFRGMQLVVTGRYHGNGAKAIEVTGRLLDKEWKMTYEGKFAENDESKDFVPRVWAMRKIGELLTHISLIKDPNDAKMKELRGEVVHLARRFGIVTPYTSYLVMENTAKRVPRPGPWARRGAAPGGRPAPPLALRKMAKEAEEDMKKDKGEGALREAKARRELLDAEKPAADAFGLGGGKSGSHYERLRQGFGGKVTRYVKTVGAKTFYCVGDTWYDSSYDHKKHKKVTKVKFMSEQYIRLLSESPEIAKYLALGKKVVIVLGDKVYEVTDEDVSGKEPSHKEKTEPEKK